MATKEKTTSNCNMKQQYMVSQLKGKSMYIMVNAKTKKKKERGMYMHKTKTEVYKVNSHEKSLQRCSMMVRVGVHTSAANIYCLLFEMLTNHVYFQQNYSPI